MEKTITPTDLFDFEENNEEFIHSYLHSEKLIPKQETVNNILNYSKALSITKSTIIEKIELLLN
jgi:hypothetical protein